MPAIRPDAARAALLREARERFCQEERASWRNEAMLLADYPLAEQLVIVRNYLLAALLVRSWPNVADAVAHLDAMMELTL